MRQVHIITTPLVQIIYVYIYFLLVWNCIHWIFIYLFIYNVKWMASSQCHNGVLGMARPRLLSLKGVPLLFPKICLSNFVTICPTVTFFSQWILCCIYFYIKNKIKLAHDDVRVFFSLFVKWTSYCYPSH